MSPLPAPVQFDDRTRLYAMRIAGHAEQRFQVVDFTWDEGLSRLYRGSVNLVATETGNPLTSLLGRQAALQISLADGSRAVRSGYIQEAVSLVDGHIELSQAAG